MSAPDYNAAADAAGCWQAAIDEIRGRLDLAERLRAQRRELAAAMARDGFSAGAGALLAGLDAASAALAEAAIPAPADGTHAVATDDGNEIRLAFYQGRALLGAATLEAREAVRIAALLLDAALARLYAR